MPIVYPWTRFSDAARLHAGRNLASFENFTPIEGGDDQEASSSTVVRKDLGYDLPEALDQNESIL